GDGVPDGAGKVETQADFDVRNPAGAVAVELRAPRAGSAGLSRSGNIVLWSARKLRLVAEDGLEHALGVAHREADADGHDKGHVQKGAEPALGIEGALRRHVKAGNRTARRQKNRQINQQ